MARGPLSRENRAEDRLGDRATMQITSIVVLIAALARLAFVWA
jgi:hypothetical protein